MSLLNFAVSDGHSVICSRYVNSRTEEAASLYFSSGTGWGRMSGYHRRTDSALAKPKTQRNGAGRTSIEDSTPTSPSESRMQSEYTMDRRDRTSDLVLIASEPLTFERDSWVTVPTNSTVTIHKQTVMIHPIRDEFYVNDPGYRRTGKLVEEKGMGMSAGDSSVTAMS